MNNQTNNQPKRTITRRNRTKQSTTNKMAVVHFTHSSNRSQRLAPKLLSHHSHLLSHKLTCGAFGWPPAVESSASRGTECRPHPYVVTHTPADAAPDWPEGTYINNPNGAQAAPAVALAPRSHNQPNTDLVGTRAYTTAPAFHGPRAGGPSAVILSAVVKGQSSCGRAAPDAVGPFQFVRATV